MAVLCTGLALVLPMHGLEPFLLMLSSLVVPLYGTILRRLARVRDVASRVGARAVDWGAVAIWIAGDAPLSAADTRGRGPRVSTASRSRASRSARPRP
jgi:hypothetical protein